MDIEKKVIEEYKLSELGIADDSYSCKREATIVFVNDEFSQCNYKVSGVNNYSFEDWMFLLAVAQKIKELQKEKGGN